MNELRQDNLFLLLQFVIGPCTSVDSCKRSLQKTSPQTCLKMQTSLARDSMAIVLFNSIHSERLILFLLLGIRGSIILGFCPFNTQIDIKTYTEVQRQNSVTSAQLLTHTEHTQNEFMRNL